MNHEQSPSVYPWPIFGIASLATFLVSIDSTILYAAFNNIASSFPQANPVSISWVMNAYTIVYATTLIPAGGIADKFGRKRVFMYGVGLFVLASFLCGIAPNIYILIAARVLQALGAALLGPSSLALILDAFPHSKRTQAISAWGAVGALAAAIGPASGSFIVDSMGWEWAFFINIPVGVYCLLRGGKALQESANSHTHVRFDAVGMGLIILSVSLLTTCIIEIKSGQLSLSQILLLISLGLIGLLAFILWCRNTADPLIDLGLFNNRTYRFVNMAAFLFSITFATMFFSFFFFMTNIWHYSLPKAGLAITPGPLIVIPVAIISGKIASRLGHKNILIYGCLLFALSAVWYLIIPGLNPNYLVDWLPGQLMTGAAIGMVMPAMSAAAVHDLPKKDYAMGSAINQAIRQMGTVIGVAITVALLVHPFLQLGDFHTLYQLQIGLVLAAALLVTQVDTKPKLERL